MTHTCGIAQARLQTVSDLWWAAGTYYRAYCQKCGSAGPLRETENKAILDWFDNNLTNTGETRLDGLVIASDSFTPTKDEPLLRQRS